MKRFGSVWQSVVQAKLILSQCGQRSSPFAYVTYGVTSLVCSSPCGLYTFCRIAAVAEEHERSVEEDARRGTLRQIPKIGLKIRFRNKIEDLQSNDAIILIVLRESIFKISRPQVMDIQLLNLRNLSKTHPFQNILVSQNQENIG